MKKNVLLVLAAPRTRARAVKGKKGIFLKEVIREGRYLHPNTGRELDATPERMATWVENTKRLLAAGVKVWLPDGHSDRADDNVGYALDFLLAPSPGPDGRPSDASPTVSVYAKVRVHDRRYLEKIGKTIRDVSIGLAEVTDGHGVDYGECIYHVALTSSPVVHTQANFVALASRFKGRILSFSRAPEQRAMPKSIIGTALTATKDPRIGSVAVTGTLRTLFSKHAIEVGDRARRSDLEALAEKIAASAAPATIDDEKVLAHLSVDVKKQAFAREYLAQREKSNAAIVDAATKSGRLTADMAKEVKTLLSIRHGYVLSKDGAASAVDVGEVVERLLAAIPEHAVVDLKTRIEMSKGRAVAGPPNEPEGLDDEKVKKEVERGLASIPGHKPKK